MFKKEDIKKLLEEVIPNSPSEGQFAPYSIDGISFSRDEISYTPTLIFKAFHEVKKEYRILRSIYFQLNKDNSSANCKMIVFSGTNEVLSKLSEENIKNKISTVLDSMITSLTEVK